jgi:hypothetical protein
MKKFSISYIVFVLLVVGYSGSVAGSIFVDRIFIIYGLLGIGLYFGPVALILLGIDRVFNKDYDKGFFKKSLIFVGISMLISGVTIMWVNSSLNINMI